MRTFVGMKNCIDKIAELQLWLKNNGFGGCIIPNADPHQSEYVEDHYKLRGYFSGFTGSAGTLVVTCGKAALFTDSRYHIQAALQLEGSGIELFKSGLPDVPLYGLDDFPSIYCIPGPPPRMLRVTPLAPQVASL